MKTPKSLTPKEKSTLEFIEAFIGDNGFSPTFTEIKEHFGYASYNSVQRYLKQLETKGYIHLPGGNQKRAIQVVQSSSSFQSNVLNLSKRFETSNRPQPNPKKEASRPAPTGVESLSIPLLGDVAAGVPIEAQHANEYVDVPLSLVKQPQETFALQVKGESMIDDGIFDGDMVLVQSAKSAKNGDIIVAVVENEATIKRIYFHEDKSEGQIELRPANSTMEPMWFSGNQVEIRGRLVSLIRQF